jgi:hypothetical protein
MGSGGLPIKPTRLYEDFASQLFIFFQRAFAFSPSRRTSFFASTDGANL